MNALAVVGSRTLPPEAWPWARECIANVAVEYSEVRFLISGGAQGADQMAERYADSIGWPPWRERHDRITEAYRGHLDWPCVPGPITPFYEMVAVLLPAYELHGRRAPLVRNESVVELADVLLALVPDGPPTSGTQHVGWLARQKGIPVLVEVFRG